MFQCQHGPTECMGNKVHACSIKHIKDDRKLTDYIHCMIEDNYDPKEVGQSVRSPQCFSSGANEAATKKKS